MPLMDRIKVKDFLSMDIVEQTTMIEELQQLRTNDQIEARAIASKGNTKSARKNKAKRGKKVVDPTKALNKLLGKLTKAEIAALTKTL